MSDEGFISVGYDGNPYTSKLTNGFAKTIDLTEYKDLGVTYDWVQSFEVGEHIPVDKTDTFISNIVRHANKGILLSWAIKGQRGVSHINKRDNK